MPFTDEGGRVNGIWPPGTGKLRGWPVSRILSRRLPALDDHSSASRVATAVKLPTRAFGLKFPAEVPGIPCRMEIRTFPHKAPIRHCSGWGLPYRPGCPVRGGLLPHRFTITVVFHRWRTFGDNGRLFSVALSLGLPPPGVTRHPSFMESGLSSEVAPRGHPAIRAMGGISARCDAVNGLEESKDEMTGNMGKLPILPVHSAPFDLAP